MASLQTLARILGLVAAAPPVLDSLTRRILAGVAGNGAHAGEPLMAVDHWLVVVPARGEGSAVTTTLASVAAAAEGFSVETVLLLDGADREAQEAGRSAGAHVLVKAAAGPTKGAALAWLAEHRPELVKRAGAILVVDVGSRLSTNFFAQAAWPAGADAAQAWLRGVGSGVGDAVILSEALAQGVEDRGRQALGWNVHLRGTGTAFTPGAFRRIVPQLRTSVEDTEATLLLAAEGAKTVLMDAGAVVEDVKPSEVGVAARQRSRWLWGEFSLLVRRADTLARLVARHPLEGLSFLAGLLSRPLSLSGALRLLLAAFFLVDAVISGPPLSWAAVVVIGATLVSDLELVHRVTGMSWGRLGSAGLRLWAAWLGAVLLLPRAAFGWIRGRR